MIILVVVSNHAEYLVVKQLIGYVLRELFLTLSHELVELLNQFSTLRLAAAILMEKANEVPVGDLNEAVGANRHYRLLQRLERLKIHLGDILVRQFSLLHPVVVDDNLHVVLEYQFVDGKIEEETNEARYKVDDDEEEALPEFLRVTANNLVLHGKEEDGAANQRCHSDIFLLNSERQRVVEQEENAAEDDVADRLLHVRRTEVQRRQEVEHKAQAQKVGRDDEAQLVLREVIDEGEHEAEHGRGHARSCQYWHQVEFEVTDKHLQGHYADGAADQPGPHDAARIFVYYLLALLRQIQEHALSEHDAAHFSAAAVGTTPSVIFLLLASRVVLLSTW